jgi:hypothetical protein
MNSDDWKRVLASVAPALATALGGPIAGSATAVIANELLGKDKASESELATAVLGASPERLARLKQLSYEYEQRMAELDVDVYKISVDDKKSARRMASEVGMWPQWILSAIFIIGYFVALGFVLTEMGEIDEKVQVLAATLLGLFTREIPTIMQFWFGSSHGSKRKGSKLGIDNQETR